MTLRRPLATKKGHRLTAVGFEPTQLALVELESTPLDHSGKLSLTGWHQLTCNAVRVATTTPTDTHTHTQTHTHKPYFTTRDALKLE